MSKIHDLIANADDKTMVDFRRGSQIDSVPIEDLRPLARLWNLRKEMPYCGIEPGCECNFCDYIHGRTETHFTLEQL